MIKSMTGFGVGTISAGSDKYNIEIRSVNSRFLDIKFKGIQLDLPVEESKPYRGFLNNNNVNKSKIDNLKYLCFSIVGCFVDGILITGPDIKKYNEKEKKLNELTVSLSSLKKLRKKKNCIKN